MKLFLFLDDYLIDSKQDVVRVFPAAELKKGACTIRKHQAMLTII